MKEIKQYNIISFKDLQVIIMINVISDSNINAINNTALDIVSFLKKNKLFFSSQYDDDVRIKPSDCLFQITRTIDGSDRFLTVTSENNENVAALKQLVDNLDNLLGNKQKFRIFKIKDYSLETIKVKICRELVSQLEDLYILNEINQEDINLVYSILGKPVPKKFSANQMFDNSKEVFYAIRNAMTEQAEEIKANSIDYYVSMSNRIDPNNEFNTPQEFIKAGKRNISDMSTLRICYIYKFENDKFYSIINEEFDTMLAVAANNITMKYKKTNKPEVTVHSLTVGAKGFDLKISLDNEYFNARAIPVEGYFVRFHFRYIIT